MCTNTDKELQAHFYCQQSICTPGKGVYGLFCVVCTSRVPDKAMYKDALQSEQPFWVVKILRFARTGVPSFIHEFTRGFRKL